MNKLIEQIYTVIRYIRALGIKCGIVTLIKITRTKKTDSIHITGLKAPIRLRSNGSSDKCAFYKIILDKEYKIELPETPQFIIDAGANIGLATIYFANRYPDAKIIAIEPDKGNFEVLLENIKQYPQIIALNTSLWHRPSWTRIKEGAPGTMSFVVEECMQDSPGAMYATSLKEVMTKYNFNHIGLLKMDIEGSEKDILTNDYDYWLSRTNAFIIEIHDGIRKGCSAALLEAVRKYHFQISPKVDNLLFVKE